MKNRFGVLMAGLCLVVMSACGSVSESPSAGEPAKKDPQTGALYCQICPVAPGGVESMSHRTPVMDEKTGMYICYPCDGTYCGDGLCDYPETSSNCPSDCGSPSPYCGDGSCNNGEASTTCPGDCGTVCGDGVCNGGEGTTNCTADCGSMCGDGVCNGAETASNCASDCGGGYCGDGLCEYPETRFNCRADCYYSCIAEICP